MTQPTEAVGGEPIAPEPTLEERLSAAFGDTEQQEEEEPAEAAEEEAPEATEEAGEEAEDETADEEEADDLPPIEPPVSWDAEAKEVFKNLPREAQEIVQKREADRERFVQQKSQEAARARTEVEQEAVRQLAAYEQQVSEQLSQYARQFEVPEPDLSLLATDPQTYALQARQYQQAQAQREQAQRAAEQMAEQARQREAYAEQQELAEQHKIIVEQFPEYVEPTSGWQQKLSAIAKDVLGYPPELISQARATDILAMKRVHDLKVKADKYDALQSKKMEKVRAAKSLPNVAKPGTAQAPGAHRQQQYQADRQAMKQGDDRAAARVLDSFFSNSK